MTRAQPKFHAVSKVNGVIELSPKVIAKACPPPSQCTLPRSEASAFYGLTTVVSR